MESMRESWTDERLDDLNDKVERGFARIDERFERIDDRFDRIDDRFDRIDDRFERVGESFAALHRLMIQFCGLLVAALIGLIATQL